jgi:hypothetical protein
MDKNGIGDCEIGSCGNTFDTNPTGVASVGTIVQRITSGTATPLTVAALALDVASVGCVVLTEGGCTPLAVAAMRTSFAAAAVKDKVGQRGANYKKFGEDAGLIIGGRVYGSGLAEIRDYLNASGAGGGRVVQAIYEGLRITIGALIAR